MSDQPFSPAPLTKEERETIMSLVRRLVLNKDVSTKRIAAWVTRYEATIRELESRRSPETPAPTTASFFIPTERENDSTIAQEILQQTARMRKDGTFETQSLCWSPEQLELLAMFAINAKNELAGLPPEEGEVTEADELWAAYRSGFIDGVSHPRADVEGYEAWSALAEAGATAFVAVQSIANNDARKDWNTARRAQSIGEIPASPTKYWCPACGILDMSQKGGAAGHDWICDTPMVPYVGQDKQSQPSPSAVSPEATDDTKRLDWLEANGSTLHSPCSVAQSWCIHGGPEKRTVREAIDAARAASPGDEPPATPRCTCLGFHDPSAAGCPERVHDPLASRPQSEGQR